MAQNTTDEYRKFRYYEGVCSSRDFVKEIAKVLALGVRKDSTKDEKGNIIPGDPIMDKNWDIVYPLPSKNWDPTFAGFCQNRDSYLELINQQNMDNGETGLTDDRKISKIKNQIELIEDKVVLRTTTSAKIVEQSEVDDLSVSQDSDQATLSMYLEIWKPKYIANPEEYPLDAELYGLTPQLITKEMYKEARKSTASVIYDLAQLKDDQHDTVDHSRLVTSQFEDLMVSATSLPVSNVYEIINTNDSDTKFKGIASLFGVTDDTEVLAIPDGYEVGVTNPATGKPGTGRITYCELSQAHLNTIKQERGNGSIPYLYNFIMETCNLRSTFTETDYDLIQKMEISLSYLGDTTSASQQYTVTFIFNKNVEVFTIGRADDSGNRQLTLYAEKEYGHKALDMLHPEIYCEGRYTPLPEKYIDSATDTFVQFSSEDDYILKFCLDHVVDSKVLYGTIVLRYEYDKQLDYADISSLKITDSVALENNHYCLMRMFDNPNSDFSGPEPNIYDNDGKVTATNSHASPWSKLSWYQDFEEIMMDSIDEDVSVTSVTDGTLLVPLETAGLTSDTRLSYWINTNNDRFTLVVMGNPALDYERDRHLISSCYCGRIESFENSIHDVSGNFALYTSSSTTPCKTVMTAHDTQFHMDQNFKNEVFLSGTQRLDELYPSEKYYLTKYNNIDDSAMTTPEQYNLALYKYISTKIAGAQPCTYIEDQTSSINGSGEASMDIYYITLTGNKYFNESEYPFYMIVDNRTGLPRQIRPGVYYERVPYKQYIYGTSDSRSNQIKIWIQNDIPKADKPNYTVYFNFGYYEEKFIIKSGITRDMFGNVIAIETIDDYGKNTSDGTTSVSMYHTRSKAFYQKHHFLFATTEEYMSKVMYGKSSYTGEYYADRIKITHGNDGPRGILSDTLVIDSSSLYPKDELVINKDFRKNELDLEETFAYFPITAPFSPLSDGPNARYGIALKKDEKENTDSYTIEKQLRIAVNELDSLMAGKQILQDDIVLESETEKAPCKIYWEVVEDSSWMYEKQGSTKYKFTNIRTNAVTEYPCIKYAAPNVQVTWTGFEEGDDPSSTPTIVDFTKAAGTNPTVNFQSEITLRATNSVNLADIQHMYYGYSDNPITSIPGGTLIVKIIDDKTNVPSIQDNIHTYPFYHDDYCVYVTHEIDRTVYNITNSLDSLNNLQIQNAHPSKYLNIFFTTNNQVLDDNGTLQDDVIGTISGTSTQVCNQKIVKFASILLNNFDNTAAASKTNAQFTLLKYPCNISVYGVGITDINRQQIYDKYMNTDTKVDFNYTPYLNGNSPLRIKVYGLHGEADLQSFLYGSLASGITPNGEYYEIPSDYIYDDLFLSINAS